MLTALNKLNLGLMVMLLAGCGRSSFNPGTPPSTVPSAVMSELSVSPDNIADGITPAQVTVKLRTSSGQPVPNVNVKIEVSGTQNTIVPCTVTNLQGMSRCWLYTLSPGVKDITVIGVVTLQTTATFATPRPMRSSFQIVSSGDVQVLPSGRVIVATSGIVEAPVRQKDSYGYLRLFSSVLGSILGD